MQIRLTVLGPRSGRAARGCDVLITAPAGTALGSVAGALASAAGSGQAGGRSANSSVVLYAGTQRLDPNAVLGVPPLVDGALVSLHTPAEPSGEGSGQIDHGQYGRFGQYGRPPAELPRLHVVGGPDAGGVHLLPGGQARIGRSADADVPLDDPDVSRLHCEVAVGSDGEVTVADLGSTNGTTLAGRPVGPRPVPFPPGALLRIGESTLRLAGPHTPEPAPLSSVPDADGHLRVALREQPWPPTGYGGLGYGPEEARDEAAARSPYPPAVYSREAETYGRGFVSPEALERDNRQDDDAADRRRAPGERPRTAQGPTGDGDRPRGVGAIGAWAKRRLGSGREEGGPEDGDDGEAESLRGRWPDPAAVLLTALGPGRRLWERGAGHLDALTVRLGTAELPSRDGTRYLPDVPFTVDLRAPGSTALTLAGPRPRLAGLARAVLAQLCALHSPAALEIVLISADRARGADQRAEEWAWLNWLPHLRPSHGQDCRLLLAFDREQAESRTAELARRLESGPLGPRWATAGSAAVAAAAAAHEGPYTVLVVDGDPGSVALRETVARLAAQGPASGIHVLSLAEAGDRPPVATGLEARLSGDVATTLLITPAGTDPGHRPAEGTAGGSGRHHGAERADGGYSEAPDPAGPPEGVVVDAVSAAWAEHFARALAPLREADTQAGGARSRNALPATVRLLDELDLALATPAKIAARWSEAPSTVASAGAVLGLGAAGRVAVDLVAEGPHAVVGGAPGAGKTELLRSLAAALAAAERPDRLALVLLDGAGQERGEGLAVCADLPHVSTHLVASDPVRMREFAQSLTAELKRRAEVLGGQAFGAWHAEQLVMATLPHQGGAEDRKPGGSDAARWPDAARREATGTVAGPVGAADGRTTGRPGSSGAVDPPRPAGPGGARQDIPRRGPAARDAGPQTGPDAARRTEIPRQGPVQQTGGDQPGTGSWPPPALPRLVVLVDDFDVLVAPPLGSPGRPAAGSVVRALEAVAREGERLGVHLVFSTGRPERTAGTEADERARLRVALRMPDPESATLLVHVEDPAGLDDSVPGRGYLRRPGGAVTAFQAARVSARIPRTATLRPTVVPLEWDRMGDPPARRHVRELGNGPTDLALLASALERAAAESAGAAEFGNSPEEGSLSAVSRAIPLI